MLYEEEENNVKEDNVGFFLESRKGKTILQVNGERYRKVYKTKHGTRWNCSRNKSCTAFLYLNDDDEIIMSSQQHDHHEKSHSESIDADQKDSTDDNEFDVAILTKTKRGGTVLKLNGFAYKKAYKGKDGYHWVCTTDEKCPAFLVMNKNDKILLTHEEHDHQPRTCLGPIKTAPVEAKSQGVLVKSRNGNENLLYRQFAYRRQYEKAGRIRWICSTMKYCRACVFSDSELQVVAEYPDHCHEPPKYYNRLGTDHDIIRVDL